jgi:hypothetical protein
MQDQFAASKVMIGSAFQTFKNKTALTRLACDNHWLIHVGQRYDLQIHIPNKQVKFHYIFHAGGNAMGCQTTTGSSICIFDLSNQYKQNPLGHRRYSSVSERSGSEIMKRMKVLPATWVRGFMRACTRSKIY